MVEYVVDGLRAILAHKLRSFLTLSGIVFGVAAVVSMFSIVAGIQQLVISDFDAMGMKESFSYGRHTVRTELARERASKGMVYGDAAALGSAPAIAHASAVLRTEEIGQGSEEPHRFPVLGVSPEYFQQQRMVLTEGRNLTDLDVAERHHVAVVGENAAAQLFGRQNAIGRMIRLGGERYTVVGRVRAVRFRLIPQDWSFMERRVFVPVTTLMAETSPGQSISSVQLTARSVDEVGPGLRDTEAKLLARHRGAHDFEVDNMAAETGRILSLVRRMMAGWNLVLGAIAIISLLVGGIGLFSIMQIAVRERVREIGIRKAVGADDSDIRREFLAESLTLALAGGLAGILLGSGIILIAEKMALRFGKTWEIPISIPGAVVGVLFAAIVGLLFGLYPASKAARLDPIEAIRD
jgi:putative ABC transport system permease protein